jgi:hypothetical protein
MNEEFITYLYGIIFHEVLHSKLYLDECTELNNYDGTLIDYQIQIKDICSIDFPSSSGDSSSISSVIATSWNFSLLWEFRFYLWEKLHSYHWNYLGLLVYREWFGMITSMILLFCLSQPSKFSQKQLLHLADIGLLLSPVSSIVLPSSVNLSSAASSMTETSNDNNEIEGQKINTDLPPMLVRSQAVLQEIIDFLQVSFVDQTSSSKLSVASLSCPAVVQMNILPVCLPPTFPVTLELSMIEKTDLVNFYQNFFLKQLPVVIKNGCGDFLAVKKWSDINYLIEGELDRLIFMI